jgi:hypothetical protein
MMTARRLIIIAAIPLFTLSAVAASPIIFVVRHAEKSADGNDPDLSAAGQERAEALARIVKDAEITAIFTTEFKRTQETAAPIAKELHVSPTVIPADQIFALVEKLRGLKGNGLVNAQNARRCSPVSDIPITEKLLLNAGGWQAMKPARELLKSGRVSEAKYEPPLLSGYVREGAKNYRSGLRIKSAIDVENLCSCWESRSAGKICAHSVAVGLGYLNPPAAVVAAPNEPTMPEAPAGPRFVAMIRLTRP